MAVTHIFDTKYFGRQVDAENFTNRENGYRIIIADNTGVVNPGATEVSLLEPGMSIEWQGDDNMTTAVMGSSLSFSAVLTDDQLSTVRSFMGHDEGAITCLFFDSDHPNAEPYWYGHLLMESVSIRVANEEHFVDMTFTDGLGSLRGAEWKDASGNQYTGFRKLSYYVREIVEKLPGYATFKDYHETYLSNTAIPITREVAWPDPCHRH